MAKLLEFDVATGLYTAGGKEIVDAVRRAVSHPTTVGLLKRAVSENHKGHSEHVDVPVWSMVLLGVSFYVAIITMSLVSSNPQPRLLNFETSWNADLTSLVVLHAQRSRRYSLHGRNPQRSNYNLPL